MGARVIRQRASAQTTRHQTLAFFGIAASVVLPLILAYVLAALDMRTDLSDLKALPTATDGGTALVGWADLESTPWRLSERERMIGYMMDGADQIKEGVFTSTFVLMSEAGHFLHPPHREPDEMVNVRLRRAAPFIYRQLIWVTGMLTRNSDKGVESARYTMWDASLFKATQPDITRWFSP